MGNKKELISKYTDGDGKERSVNGTILNVSGMYLEIDNPPKRCLKISNVV